MKKLLLLPILLTFSIAINAQEFLRPFEGISRKKDAYITLEDGTEIKSPVKRLKFKKGLIRGFSILDENKKKKVIPIEDVKYAYLPQNGMDKFSKATDFPSDATQWSKGLYDKERLKEGYAFFEKVTVQLKKEKAVLLLQLLNPSNTSRIKVFHDRVAGESGGFRPGGLKVSKSVDKSYYIQKDGQTTVRYKVRDFKREFKETFGDCPELLSKYEKRKWKQFEEIIFFYNEQCGG